MTDAQRLTLVRALHTVIYIVMAASTLVVLYAGVVGAWGAWIVTALGLVGVETVVFVGAGLKCPLTALVATYGATTGPVSDTFLPERLTRHTLLIFGPLLALGVALLAARLSGVLPAPASHR